MSVGETGYTGALGDRPPRGWGWPGDSRKAHYFINYRSLCLRWGYTGALSDDLHNSPDNCAECKRKYAKLNTP